MNTEDKFNVINSMFRDNPNFLVRSHRFIRFIF